MVAEDIYKGYRGNRKPTDIIGAESMFKDQVWPMVDSDEDPIAIQVLEEYGINIDNLDSVGSTLPGYDIYNRDAYRMIQLSLAADSFANDSSPIRECYIDADGNAKFYTLGQGETATDIYFSTKADSYKLPCNNVIVTGCEIPPIRETRDPQNLLTIGNDPLSSEDPGPWYHILGEIIPSKNTYQEGWIEYNRFDFNREREKEIWQLSEFEKIATFAYKTKIDFWRADSTNVEFRDRSLRYYELPGFGEMQASNEFKRQLTAGEEPPILKGVEVPLSDHVKFLGVRNVILYGYKLDRINFYRDEQGINPEPWVLLETLNPNPFTLRRGEDYVINKEEGKPVTITFANNVIKEEYQKFFGKDPALKETSRFKIHPASIAIIEEPIPASEVEILDPEYPIAAVGTLKDGVSKVAGGQALETSSVFPIGRGESGYAVIKIFVEVEWDNPCIYIKDDRDIIRTERLMSEVHFDIYPIVIDDPPAPIARNGELVKQIEMQPDDDATTIQFWNRSEIQIARDSLKGGDIDITLPFLNEEQTRSASSRILAMRQEDVEETTFICGPNCMPDLCASAPNGEEGVINEITYSYQDSSHYEVSVRCGSRWLGMGGWSQSINETQVGQVSLDGTVINAHPNNVDFIVNIDRIGQVPCINATKDIICNGDKVKVTVYNHPLGVR